MICHRRYILLGLLFTLALFINPVRADEKTGWSIDQLMQLLAQTRSGHASFTEIKSIAMLDRPVESSGELFYKAPDYFEKRTLKPKADSMVLDGGTLIVERGGKKRSLQLQNYPEVAAFIDSIRGTLAGDRKSLERTYQLTLEGDAHDWKLLLVPMESKMKKVVERIDIAGVKDEIRTILISQADGDSSRMSIVKLGSEKLSPEKLPEKSATE